MNWTPDAIGQIIILVALCIGGLMVCWRLFFVEDTKGPANIGECESHIKTAIGNLDDPTGPHVVEDVRRAKDALLLALAALRSPLASLRRV